MESKTVGNWTDSVNHLGVMVEWRRGFRWEGLKSTVNKTKVRKKAIKKERKIDFVQFGTRSGRGCSWPIGLWWSCDLETEEDWKSVLELVIWSCDLLQHFNMSVQVRSFTVLHLQQPSELWLSYPQCTTPNARRHAQKEKQLRVHWTLETSPDLMETLRWPHSATLADILYRQSWTLALTHRHVITEGKREDLGTSNTSSNF